MKGEQGSCGNARDEEKEGRKGVELKRKSSVQLPDVLLTISALYP